MATGSRDSKGKVWAKTAGYGVLSLSMYAAVFLNSELVMTYFTKGAWYASLPIATVFLISFAHGAFTSYLWSALGVEARKVQERREEKPVYERKRPRARLHMSS